MKKLVNDVHAVVRETLEGFALAHPDLVDVHYSPDFVTRAVPKAEGKVGLVSGGGSGHEPLHAGFVGEGMLDAAVPGAVFTSPTPDPILEATKAADRGAGVLHIVKNYTGDVLNFETAAELADMEDIQVSTVIVNDDVAVEDSLYTAGRRGCRARRRPGGSHPHRHQGQRPDSLDGPGPGSLHCAPRRQALLRPGRG